MKLSKFCFFAAVGLALVFGVTGCKKKPKSLTDIPGRTAKVPTTEPAGPIGTEKPATPDNSGRMQLPPGSTLTPEPLVASKPMTEPPAVTPTDGSIATAPGMDEVMFDGGKYGKDPDFFKANTVYFDFDRSTVRAGERVKVEEVALYLKGDGNVKLLVEGHCDERGTEEYNRALGERRALSLREYLVNLGISPDRIYTISYGEDQPAVPGHNEAAWTKNRRGSFVLLKPKP